MLFESTPGAPSLSFRVIVPSSHTQFGAAAKRTRWRTGHFCELSARHFVFTSERHVGSERNAVMIKAKNGRDVIPSLRDSRERAACPHSHHQARPRGATTGEIGSITSSQHRPIVAVTRFAPNVSTLCHSPAELHHSPVCRQSLHQRMLNPAGRERSCPGITPPERIRAGVNRPALPFTLTGV